jgi:hypothetical protein
MRPPTLVLVAALFTAAPLLATVKPATEQFLPSVAHAAGALPGSMFQTDVWIFNPGSVATTVTISFYYRGPSPALSPDPISVDVDAGAVSELDDIIATEFGLGGAVGGLRIVSTQPVTVTARIYDAAVEGTNGTGTAGQFFAATPLPDAIPAGAATDLVGMRAVKDAGAAIATWRTNVGFMNASAATTVVHATLILGDGTDDPPTSSTVEDTFTLGPYEPRQLNDVFVSLKRPYDTNVRCHLEVVSGGPVVAFGSMLDGRTNDPSTLDMTAPLAGGWDGTWVCKQDKTTYDTPVTITIAGGALTQVDATIVFTAEDAGSACGGELLRLAGSLPAAVIPDDLGNFAFSLTGSVDGVGVSFSAAGALSPQGGVTGTATTTLTGAGGCSGTKTWPLVGARLPL